MVEPRWTYKYSPAETSHPPWLDLARETPCSTLVAGLLHHRGIVEPAAARAFLHPKLTDLHAPELLPDMDKATARIAQAIRNRESVAIFGDYDVDGVTSTCLLEEFFDLVGFPVRHRLPNRLAEGYGLRSDSVRELAREGTRLIITVDNGSSSVAEVALARQLGVDVVVTDHHDVPPELPAAVAVVNPCREDSTYPFQHLAGVGVAFKVVWALAQRLSRQKKLSDEFRNFLLESLALVGLGTISDVVPLLGENRVLAKFGLAALENTRRPGLRPLVQSILGEKGKRHLDARDVAFRIGPRINAAGRLGQPDAALRLLLTRDEQEGLRLLDSLEKENRRRQKIEQEIHAVAREIVEREVDLPATRAIVLAGQGWHPGVIGIVAARLVEEYYRPTLLISLEGDRGRGSARSIRGVHLCEALAECGHCLAGFGGHAMAAGVEVERRRVDELREELNKAIGLSPEEMVPRIDVDADVLLSDISLETLDDLALLAPHGTGNPQPLFAAQDLDIVGVPKILGRDGRHLAFHVRQNGAVFRAIAFGKGEYHGSVTRRGTRISLLLEPRISRWQGRSEIELNVRDLRVS